MATAAMARVTINSAWENCSLTRPERAFLANQDRLERGIPQPVEAMENSGVRLRSLASPSSSTSKNDNGDSPTTTTSSGTRTPGSGEDVSQVEGNMLCREGKRVRNGDLRYLLTWAMHN
jgi:hypothetical protein